MIMAILMMVVVAAIVVSLSIVSSRSTERSRDAQRRVSNDATIQTAVTRMAYAYQNDLGSEQDYYVLDESDLRQLSQLSSGSARVVRAQQLPGLPPELLRVDRVWEHTDAGGRHRLVPINGVALPRTLVEEQVRISRSVCIGAGLPASACAQGDVRTYWQPYRVVMPDITGNEAPNVVVYLRSFMGSVRSRAYSKASYARAELRPGRFADYQQISDGNVRIGSGARINGPIHSNGLADGSFSTVQNAPIAANRWIYVEGGVGCSGDASLSITAGRIVAPGACRSLGATGQTISFLRAIDAIETIRRAAAAGRPGTRSFNGTGHRGAEGRSEPYNTAWRVTLNGTSMSVRRPDGSSGGSYPLGRVNAFVFDEDVRVRGRAAPDVRVTIAAERRGSASASIFIDGNLIKGDDRTSAIGLLAQGDVVLWMAMPSYCPTHTVQAAIVAATGGMTIPTRYTTNELQSTAPRCGSIVIDWSVAGHRPPTLIWSWPGGYGAGYGGMRDYRWDRELKRNPPPYFPLTGTWQPFQVREANVDCLFNPARTTDPDCR